MAVCYCIYTCRWLIDLSLSDRRYLKDFKDLSFFKAFNEAEVGNILGGAEVRNKMKSHYWLTGWLEMTLLTDWLECKSLQQLVNFEAGEKIIAEGGQARWVFILCSGSAILYYKYSVKNHVVLWSNGDLKLMFLWCFTDKLMFFDDEKVPLQRWRCCQAIWKITVQQVRFYTKNDGFYTKNDGFYTENAGFFLPHQKL